VARGAGRLLGATAVSSTGDGVSQAALPLLAAGLTRDPLTLSLVTVAGWLPWLLVGLVSGALVDRWDRRRTMWLVDGARCVLAAVLTALVATGRASITLLAGLAFALGTGQTLYDNATQAIVPAVTGREPVRLARMNSRLAAAQMAGKELAGPPLGGFLFTLVGWVPFALDAVSFGAASALVAGMPGRFRPGQEGPRSLRREIGEGLRWLWRSPLVRTLAWLIGLINAAWTASSAVMVLFAQDLLGVDGAGYGLLLAALAVGGLPGSLVAARLSRRIPAGRLLIGGVLAMAACQAAVGLAGNAWMAGAALLVAGAVFMIWDVASVSLRQELIPDRLMGRVMGAVRLVGYGSIPLGALLGGVTGRLFGLRAPFLISAAMVAVAVIPAGRVLTTDAIEAARDQARTASA
jgi:MFS family permease